MDHFTFNGRPFIGCFAPSYVAWSQRAVCGERQTPVNTRRRRRLQEHPRCRLAEWTDISSSETAGGVESCKLYVVRTLVDHRMYNYSTSSTRKRQRHSETVVLSVTYSYTSAKYKNHSSLPSNHFFTIGQSGWQVDKLKKRQGILKKSVVIIRTREKITTTPMGRSVK